MRPRPSARRRKSKRPQQPRKSLDGTPGTSPRVSTLKGDVKVSERRCHSGVWQTARKTEQPGGITFTDAKASVTRDEVHKRDLEAAVALHEGAVPCTTTQTAC